MSVAPITRPGQAMPRGVVATITTLRISDEISEEAWSETLRIVSKYSSAAQWWIGDALVFGEVFNRDDEREYDLAVRITGLAEPTLKQYKSVASRFPEVRRRPSLSWSHHLYVLPLDRADQEMWLDRADRDGMGALAMRNAVAEAGMDIHTSENGVSLVPFSLKTDESRVERWRHAARVAGLVDGKGEPDLRTWVLNVLDEAAA